jgi:hypothetical protein
MSAETHPSPNARGKAMRLLRAIYEKTHGRGRAVRDVTELATDLTDDDAKAAWRVLLDLGLLERFSQDYVARISRAGVEFIDSGQLLAEEAELTRKVFIVRGPDTEAREAVLRFVEEIGFRAVLLQDQADPGKTIMEQVERLGDVYFAAVLLTPDDLGSSAGAAEFRPRMNVLMELGYFLGRLGRGKVCAFAISSAMDLPSDLAGVALQPFDAFGGWKSALSRVLQAAGYEIGY